MSRSVKVGGTAKFYCHGEKVTWKHHRGPLPHNAETGYGSIKFRSFLKITDVQLQDGGDYQCFSETDDYYVYEDKRVLYVTCEYLVVYVL